MTRQKNVAILGATGSIGSDAVAVVLAHPDRLRVSALAAHSRVDKLAAAARATGCGILCVTDTDATDLLRAAAPKNCEIFSGEAALDKLAVRPETDTLLCAIVGMGGLRPVLAALRAGKTVALASKEVLVSAGELVMRTAKKHGGAIVPVDSEHSALFQCLDGRDPRTVKKLILTASGGAFRDLNAAQLEHVTAREALAHPVWSMGAKVTIDSASLMNKALELVEAHHLFGCGNGKLGVLLHRQSIVHSLVEFRDGTQLALLSQPDMKLPIQYALSYPERWPAPVARLDLAKARRLDFSAPDPVRFRALGFAREAIRRGGTLGAAMNAANEVAVEFFRRGAIAFPRIWSIIEETMTRCEVLPQSDFETIETADAEARRIAVSLIERI